MPSVTRNGEEERLVLSTVQARETAGNFDGNDPFPCIPPALLSADHIVQYAEKTGMIAPIFCGGDRTRMKKASYEGRIECAYKFDNDGKSVRLRDVPINDGILNVEANSIVFVECDIEFNLPDFIAVRFNLHIRHVHRGLLLGTGPLVDPGYQGKLCIPLHNLTDNDYPIPVSQGLVWMEFTKTSAKNSSGQPPGGRNPRNVNWDSRKFIMKAAAQYEHLTVPIRSSIPVSVRKAEESARKSEKSARTAESTAKNIRNISIVAGLAVAVTIGGLVVTVYQTIQSAYHSVAPQAREADKKSASNEKDIEVIRLRIKDMEEEIRVLRGQITDAQSQDNSP